MSLLDTFADDLADGGLDVFAADENLLSTFASGDDDPELRWLLNVAQTAADPGAVAAGAAEPEAHTPAPAIVDGPEARPAKRKRRKKGEVDDAAPLSRSAICKAAAQARWHKVREDKLSAASSPTTAGSIVVVIPAAESRIVAADGIDVSSATIVSFLQKRSEPKMYAGSNVKEIFDSGK